MGSELAWDLDMSQSATFGHRPGSGADRSSIVPLGNHDADKPKLGGVGACMCAHERERARERRKGRGIQECNV